MAQPVGGPGNVTFTPPLTLTYFRPTQPGWLSEEELGYLELFRHELIYTIVGEGHSPSWKRMILQAVHEEVALCHAVVAFSALTSRMRSRPSSPSSSGSSPPAMDNEFALQHYGKALECMRHVVHQNDTQSINTALLCTLLCICFELRMRDPASALTHLEPALQLISGNMEAVDNAIITAFARLDLQAALFLGMRPPVMDPEKLATRLFVFDSVFQEADVKLMGIVNHIYRFIRGTADNYRYREQGPAPDFAYSEEANLNIKLQSFYQRYLEPQEKLAKMSVLQIALLRIKYLMAVIVMAGSLDPEETAYYRFTAEFAEITQLAAEILHHCRQKQNCERADFALDMTVMHPLYITATKCRSPVTRRRAIQLMLTAPEAEGAWDSTGNAIICEQVMLMEETGIEFDLGRMGAEDLLHIPEDNLVHAVDVYLEPTQRFASIYMSRRLSGLDQEWNNIRQDVTW